MKWSTQPAVNRSRTGSSPVFRPIIDYWFGTVKVPNFLFARHIDLSHQNKYNWGEKIYDGEKMKVFNYSKLKDAKWDIDIVNYLTAIHEEKGKQQLYLKQLPLELDKLVEIAKIQSTESSNEIEGIRTTDTRLRQIVNDKTTPKNRAEAEIAGYRDALEVVHENFDSILITPNFILQLHDILLSHAASSYGGKFKNVQNYISATDRNGKSYTLFTPLSPFETPIAMQGLCDEYNRAIGEGVVDPLILIPIFIHDFLCIHPFIDGNGRMSRLLTTLLLYRSGYYVGKYISLEAKIVKNKDLYYDAFYDSQQNWHENKDDPTPFIKYLLSTIISAYRDFEERVELVKEKKPALEIVRQAINTKIGKFSKRDIMELVPSLSSTSVERSLQELCNAGEIKKIGSGRATAYFVIK